MGRLDQSAVLLWTVGREVQVMSYITVNSSPSSHMLIVLKHGGLEFCFFSYPLPPICIWGDESFFVCRDFHFCCFIVNRGKQNIDIMPRPSGWLHRNSDAGNDGNA